ncbi:MAG: hypothetical protein ACKV1O_13485 [Saprospiraceae bacterium]
MKNSIKKLIFLWLGVLVTFVVFIACIVITTDYTSTVPQERPCVPKPSFHLDQRFATIDATKIRELFPYQIYLDSADWCDVNAIVRDLHLLDSINKDSTSLNREILVKALTEELENQVAGSFVGYHPDSLILLLQWAVRFNNYQELDKDNSKVFRVIYRHWFNFVSNKLGDYAKDNPEIKYDFKFKYLVGICHAKKFSPPIGSSMGEKIVNYFIEKNYSYLFNRFWNATGILFKVVVVLGLAFLIYAFWCVIKVHFGKKH